MKLSRRVMKFLLAELRPLHARINDRGAKYLPISIDKLIFNSTLRAKGLAVAKDHLVVHGDGSIAVAPGASGTADLSELPDGDYFVKRVSGSQGGGALAFGKTGDGFRFDDGPVTAEEARARLVEAARSDRSGRALVQDRVVQHPELTELSPFTVNTLRTLTFWRRGGKPELLHSVLRVGRSGSIVDNASAGGFVVLVRSGMTEGPGRDKSGKSYDRHPDTGEPLSPRAIPMWSECVKLCLDAHALFPGLYSVGWDVAVSKDGPLLLESNLQWDSTLHAWVDPGFSRNMAREGLRMLPGAVFDKLFRRGR